MTEVILPETARTAAAEARIQDTVPAQEAEQTPFLAHQKGVVTAIAELALAYLKDHDDRKPYPIDFYESITPEESATPEDYRHITNLLLAASQKYPAIAEGMKIHAPHSPGTEISTPEQWARISMTDAHFGTRTGPTKQQKAAHEALLAARAVRAAKRVEQSESQKGPDDESDEGPARFMAPLTRPEAIAASTDPSIIAERILEELAEQLKHTPENPTGLTLDYIYETFKDGADSALIKLLQSGKVQVVDGDEEAGTLDTIYLRPKEEN